MEEPTEKDGPEALTLTLTLTLALNLTLTLTLTLTLFLTLTRPPKPPIVPPWMEKDGDAVVPSAAEGVSKGEKQLNIDGDVGRAGVASKPAARSMGYDVWVRLALVLALALALALTLTVSLALTLTRCTAKWILS